jgi:hypothetical protein
MDIRISCDFEFIEFIKYLLNIKECRNSIDILFIVTSYYTKILLKLYYKISNCEKSSFTYLAIFKFATKKILQVFELTLYGLI